MKTIICGLGVVGGHLSKELIKVRPEKYDIRL